MGGKDASQTRYIFTKLTKDARTLFDSRDDAILKYLVDDGNQIEPEYFVPVVPTVLVNGTEGIGTGFSCYVPPYKLEDIIENINLAIEGKQLKKMTPWFRGFKGKITQDEKDEHSWIMEGIYSQSNGTVKITELPPGRWTEDYKEHLEDLIEKKLIEAPYKDKSSDESVNFEIVYNGSDLIKDLKLQKSIRTSNMHLFHPVSGIKKYNCPEEIIKDFVEVRLEHYKLRKARLIRDMSETLVLIRNKARFIQMVSDGDLIVFKRTRVRIEEDLVHKKFEKVQESFEYLFDIKTYQYTSEAVDKLKKELTKLEGELESLSAKSEIDLWKLDQKTILSK
jgi:DNA topoisomerase-2